MNTPQTSLVHLMMRHAPGVSLCCRLPANDVSVFETHGVAVQRDVALAACASTSHVKSLPGVLPDTQYTSICEDAGLSQQTRSAMSCDALRP